MKPRVATLFGAKNGRARATNIPEVGYIHKSGCFFFPPINQPDAVTFAGRSSVAVVMLLLTKVGKVPDSSVEAPPPFDDPPSKVSVLPVPCIDKPGVVASCCCAETPARWTAVATMVPVVKTSAVVMLVESPVLCAVGAPASKGTMADSVAAFSDAIVAAFASALASALTRFLSATSFSRCCSTASSSWGALHIRTWGRFCSRVPIIRARTGALNEHLFSLPPPPPAFLCPVIENEKGLPLHYTILALLFFYLLYQALSEKVWYIVYFPVQMAPRTSGSSCSRTCTYLTTRRIVSREIRLAAPPQHVN